MNYYGDVDSNLEIKLDTLDDLFGEAGEIDAVNDWVTYGLPLQRFREFGSHIKALDGGTPCHIREIVIRKMARSTIT